MDRRLGAVAEIDVPFYPGLQIGVPSLPGIVDALAEGRYDVVHVCSPGPAGIGACLIARVLELPVLGSYHTELAAYAGLRSGQPQLEALASIALAAFSVRAKSCCPRARPATSGSASSESRPSGSVAGIAASMSGDFTPSSGRPDCCQTRSMCSTRGA
ncbi:MAG: glycosyltransferase [Actinomycetota bacterium]|nr:glycosyltransferase [Actinomycetota bacterium]